jgi:hypothetical protein
MIPAKQLEEKWRKIILTPDGEQVIDALFEIFVMRTSHTPGDPYQTAFNEGQRDVINFLVNLARKEN